jgi:ABC-type sugar transport system permease subunit
MVTNDLFVQALGWTLVFAFGSLFLQLIVGLVAALLLNELAKRKGEWMQAIVFSPYFSAPLAAGVIWSWFLDPNFGFTGRIFRMLGMQPIAFLAQGIWPFVMLIVAQTWHDYAYAGIIYAAALQSIPGDQYEAAAIDGASRLQRFRDVTLPHLLTPTAIILAIRTTWNLSEFSQPFELVGLARETMLLSILTYRVAYINFNFGRAYTIGMVMIAISIIAAIVYLKVIKDEQQLYV